MTSDRSHPQQDSSRQLGEDTQVVSQRVGLGVPLPPAPCRGVGRLGQMRRDPGRGQLLGHIPPARAPLHRERHVLPAGEPRQPRTQMRPVSRGDLTAPDLPVSVSR
jgi:hypothetical protein